jgi:hypothetical protein
VVLGSFLGLVGFFAAPVVAVASQVIWEQYLELRTGQRSRPEQVEIKIGSLQKRHAAAFEHYLEIKEKYPSPELNSIFERLERFLRHTQQLAEEDFADG